MPRREALERNVEYMALNMDDQITAAQLAMDDEEIARLLQCERRLAAVARWLEANQPDVFSRGLWDAINEA
jgi:hypothetical protein